MTPNIGFATPYLERLVLDVLVAKKAPGQEVTIVKLMKRYNTSNVSLLSPHRLRDHFLHAAEGFALSELEPTKVKQFDLYNPVA